MHPDYDLNIPNVIDDCFFTNLKPVEDYDGGLFASVSDSTNTPPQGVLGMNWIALVNALMPLIIDCLNARASEAEVEAALRTPSTLQRKRMRKQIRKHLKRVEPQLRRSERKERAVIILDDVVERGHTATSEEIREVIGKARNPQLVA